MDTKFSQRLIEILNELGQVTEDIRYGHILTIVRRKHPQLPEEILEELTDALYFAIYKDHEDK